MIYTRFSRATRALLGFTALVAVSGLQPAMAQSTLFNIPSTDAVDLKKVYVEVDYLGQAPGPVSPTPRLDVVTPRVVVGVAKGLEAGANISFAHISGSTQDYFQPNAKYKFYSDDKKGMAASGGLIWYVPINNRPLDNFGLVYGNFSAKFKEAKNARVTIGGYGIVAENASTPGTHGGAIVGYEQPVASKVTVLADWFSGVSGFGYLTPGVSITLPHSSLFNAGYSIGNDSMGSSASNPKNRAIFLYYGMTIG